MDDFQKSKLSDANRQAWDSLYADTPDLVWGTEPVGFLCEFQDDILSRLRPSAYALDAATGEGRNLELMLGWGAQVIACDASSHGPRAARDLPSDAPGRAPAVQYPGNGR